MSPDDFYGCPVSGSCLKDPLTSQQDMKPEEKKSYKNLNNLNHILDFITLKHKCSSLKKLCKTGHSSGGFFFYLFLEK